ncbi:NAD(P)H-binding protein [Amycolatopsis sp., V23-08]|uniref:NAD(P)H-binding protein n=1 Tax=Amycolatopsis heterodermiae TaxID=3110235 RepID=A0ABU5RL10_9PSEU|nr:NAD(P)H-binding protein [Amycolatopsis sp., V23-08]MEA5366873.1 NAD(P)H-binding protein [Amycolatopsis sp., V23-08]
MITVMGATGNVGRPLVRVLAAAGEQVAAVSRQKTPDVPDGVRVVPSVESALDGVEALFLMVPGGFAPLDDLLAAARSAGVGRVVLLSSQGVATGRHPTVLEDSVRASGLKWTMLRPGGFASNAFQWAESVRTARKLAAPFGDVALPLIDPQDIAEVAASALLSDRSGDIYELTGPAAITPRQQAAAIGEALGEQVDFIPQTREEALQTMLAFMPPEVADATLNILGAPTPREQQVSPDVARVLGRPPRPFAEWAARNAAAFK